MNDPTESFADAFDRILEQTIMWPKELSKREVKVVKLQERARLAHVEVMIAEVHTPGLVIKMQMRRRKASRRALRALRRL